MQPVRGCNGAPAGTTVLPVYRTDLSHPSSETWNVETPYFRSGVVEQAKPQGTLWEVRA